VTPTLLIESLDRSRRFDVLALLALVLGSFALGAWCIFVRHPAYYDIEWIVFERGNQLYRAARMLDGELLYRDIAFQYGPLAAYLHTAWSSVFGVAIQSTLAWHLCWSLVAIALSYRLTRRLAPPVQAAGFTLLLWVPLLLQPGGLIRIINAEHHTLERIFPLIIALLWKPPATRTAWRSVGIGLAMGAWQWTKFGGAVFAGASLFLVDLAWVCSHNRAAASWKRWLSSLSVIAVTVLFCEGLLAAWCLTWATGQETRDILWPGYMVKAYEVVVSPYWPGWHGPVYLLQYQLLPVLCLLLGVTGWLRCGSDQRVDHEVAWVAAGFYLLGIGTYIGVEANFYLYAFALAPLAVSGLVTLPGPARRVATAMLLIPFALMMRSALTPWSAPPGDTAPDQAFVLPNGESLFLTQANLKRMQLLESVASKAHEGPEARVVLAWLGTEWAGGGFIHFYEPHYPLESFFASPGMVRSADVQWMRTSLGKVGALVLYAPGGAESAAEERLHRFLPADLAAEMRTRFEKNDALSDGRYVTMTPRS